MSEAYLPVDLVRIKACIRSSMKGLVSLEIQMEQILSRDEGKVWMSSGLKPRLSIRARAVALDSLMSRSFLRHT